MSAADALNELYLEYSNSYPWQELTQESDRITAKCIASLVITSEWKNVVEAYGHHPHASDNEDAESLEESLHRWNFACGMLLSGYAAHNPEECLSVLGALFTKENSELILDCVALGLQSARVRGLRNAEHFFRAAMAVIDAKDCEQVKIALAVLHRGNDSAKRAFSEVVRGLIDTCPELRTAMSKFL